MSKIDKFWKYFTWLAVIGALCVSMFGACVSIWAVGTSPAPTTTDYDTCASDWGNAASWELVNSTYGNWLAMTTYLDCGPADWYLGNNASGGPVQPPPANMPGQNVITAAEFCGTMETLGENYDQCMTQVQGF